MNINMTDKIEKKESSELTTESDQLVGVDNIEPLIKIIRGQQVMLDRDLATLYGVETKRLNEQVKRNIKRFPEDFMFQLTKDECLRSQIATLNEGRGQHLKYMHFGADIVTRLSTGKILESTSMQPLKSVMI